MYNAVGCSRYVSPVMGEGRLNQTMNPEVTVDTDEVNVVVERTKTRLQQTIIQLRNAFHGHPLWFLQSDGMCTKHFKAQYTPPTLTQLNCRVELRQRRRCVLNSQLVGDSLDESEQFADNEVELRRVGDVNAPVVSCDLVSNFLRQSHIGCRIVNWVTTADGRVHTADTTQLDS